mgnify:CR=1 FL=1
MDQTENVRKVQIKILEIMKYIDRICRENNIEYYIMGGTALGAVRHKGFIPWDDDLDIFMTPKNYEKFKTAYFADLKKDDFCLQEWKTAKNYLEYAKLRMNGTTFIEHSFKDRKDMHQGIYVDIMILHKCPNKKRIQKRLFYKCKFVTLVGLSQRNWEPKTPGQKICLLILKLLPKKALCESFYKDIYRFDDMTDGYSYFYWITPAGFKQGLFEKQMFEETCDIPFEDTELLGSKHIKEYLSYRYGNYMKLPSKEAQKAAVHAEIFDTEKNYTEYI